jgi:4-aminobutyrate aminotransferase-like enzyme/Ser/Thr protein kinase RdoA (MazF antagonist)
MLGLFEDCCGFHIHSFRKLNGYDNANYLIESGEGKYVFKTYPFSEATLDLVEAETGVLLALQPDFEERIPKPLPLAGGAFVQTVQWEGKRLIVRLLSFLEGEFMGGILPSAADYRALGGFLAELDLGLMTQKSYVLQARKWEWHLAYPELVQQSIEDIPLERDRTVVRYFLQQYEEFVRPELGRLRKSIIYNDANEWNILLDRQHRVCLIDFGDLAYGPLVNELAVAMTYAAYDKSDYLASALEVLKAYHDKLPVQENELALLYYLIAARLCLSVCNAAHSRKHDPGNAYTSLSEANAWKMLYGWLKLNPIAAENAFRDAVGFPGKKMATVAESLQYREKYLSKILSVSYSQPIKMEKAAFQYMYDAYGNTFLDAYNNIPHVGYAHPKVVEAGRKQMASLNTNTRYLYDLLPKYAERLLGKFHPSLNRVFFVNSGSAASDLAIRMAKWHTKREGVMVLEHGYHGNTQTSIDISDYKFSNPKGQGKKEHILKVPMPDAYRGMYGGDAAAGLAYAMDAIKLMEEFDFPVAAFIAEPIVGCGGQVPLADGYLSELYPALRAKGVLCISDEVQTGFGRVGDYFWGFEQHGVIPDMVVLGKPMGNGHPMGAVVCTEEVAASFEKGVEFFSSFGGNPVSCAIGLAVLDVLEEESLQENALQVGDYYRTLFKDLQRQYACIGDVRGSGLFLGVDLVHPGSKEEDPKMAKAIKNYLREKNILISTDGPKDSIIKTKPPLIFTRENALQVAEEMEVVLKMLSGV